MGVLHQFRHGIFASLSAVVISMFIILGCGGGGSDGGSSSSSEGNDTPASVDISGTWQAEEEVDGNCGEDYPYTRILSYSVTQDGNSVTIYNNLEGTQFNGRLNGYTLTFSGSIPDGYGTLSIDFTGQCAADGQSFTGTAQWVYSETGYSCSGTTTMTCVRAGSTQISAGGNWEGTYDSLEYTIYGSFSASIVDTDGELSGTLNVPDVGISDAELTGSVTGNVITFGDIDGLITFVGTISEDGLDAEGSYVYGDDVDEGTWQASRP